MKYLLQENIQHGNSSFPVCLYDVDHIHEYESILPCHWHEEFEILYVSRGTAVFRIKDHSYEIGKGQFLFVNSGELHSACSTDKNGCRYHALVFNLSFLNSSSNDSCQSRYISPFMLKQYKLAHSIPQGNPLEKSIHSLILEMIEKLTQKNAGYELFVKGSLFLILSYMVEGGLLEENIRNSTVSGKERGEKIKRVIEYISNNYSKKIQIDELAELTDMNRYNFCRFFKGYAGMTPIEYLNLHRINEACRLLQSSGCSVTDAALQTGFESMSYFSKIFRKYKNVTPSKLKRGDY